AQGGWHHRRGCAGSREQRRAYPAARRRARVDGRLLHRLHGIPRTVDREGARHRLRELVAMVTLRPSVGGSIRTSETAPATYAFDCARSRVAVAHPAAAPHG